MSKVWLVVAQSSRAKIYETDLHLTESVEIDDLVHPGSRMHEREITSDLPGKGAGTGSGSHHGLDAQTSVKDAEVDAFARQIDSYLAAALNKGKFDKLALVAAPAFLGHLREHMNKQLADCVIYELGKSLVHDSFSELKTHLPKHL